LLRVRNDTRTNNGHGKSKNKTKTEAEAIARTTTKATADSFATLRNDKKSCGMTKEVVDDKERRPG
jgi:hypothetical protein